VSYFENDHAAVVRYATESLSIAETLGDSWLTSWPLHLLGLAAFIAADYPTARRYYLRSLEIRRAIGYREGVGILLTLLGLTSVRERNIQAAHREFLESLENIQAVNPWGVSNSLASFSRIAAEKQEFALAARLAGACFIRSESYHTPLIPLMEASLREGLDWARDALGQSDYDAEIDVGRGMPLDVSLAEARALPLDSDAAAPARLAFSGDKRLARLTPAELQVLRLLAGGRTTREIAAELVVAVSTVDRHLTHIYDKLDVRNRSGAIAFALTQGLLSS
jgi:DNA-binding CsgD family transcriptional regulator